MPALKKTKGCVLNVSSVSALRPVSCSRAPCRINKSAALMQSALLAFYGISKAALDQCTKCLAQEVAEHGVRVNSVK